MTPGFMTMLAGGDDCKPDRDIRVWLFFSKAKKVWYITKGLTKTNKERVHIELSICHRKAYFAVLYFFRH